MNQKQFLLNIEKRLKHLPKEDREDALNYYRELFADMGIDEQSDVTAHVGTPDKVAKDILADCTEKQIAIQKEKGGVKNAAKTVWLILLGICAAPVALPIAIILFSIFIVIMSIMFAIFVTILALGFAVVFSGVVSIPGIIWAPTFGQGIFMLGYSLVAVAIGVLALVGLFKLCSVAVRGIASLFQKTFGRKKVS